MDATAQDIIECLGAVDPGTREGKQAIWSVLTRCGPTAKGEFVSLRNQYQVQGLSIGDSNRSAALDIAAQLPSAAELPDGMLEGVRVGGSSAEDLEAPPGSLKGMARASFGEVSTDSRGTQLDRLMEQVEELWDNKVEGIAVSVVWIRARLKTRLQRIKPEDVPGPATLAMLIWAQKNETEFRRTFEAKLIPTKGIAESEEKGFVDIGGPIEDIMRKIGAVVDELGSKGDVQVRDLQAPESGSEHGTYDGSVPGVSECPPGGSEGSPSG